MENTGRLVLPYIMPAQAQKHVTHNEALRMLDSLIQLTVESRALTDPPATPNPDTAYLVAEPSTGDWSSQAGRIAAFVDGAWQYYQPQPGWRMWVRDEAALLIFDNDQWTSVSGGSASLDGSTLSNLAAIGVGTAGDTGNPLSVSADATLFNHTGNGHQVKLNKNSAADTASLLFQTGFSGRAEFGTTGDDNWHVKTTADGSNWHDALVADAASGAVSFPSGRDPKMLVSAVNGAGGAATVLGPPNLMTVAYQRANFTLVQNRVYFCAFYVDRPTELVGGVAAQYTASSTSGSVLRAGIYELGLANGENWDVGSLVADFGTMPADSAGHKIFDAANPVMVPPGWYLAALGSNGAGAQVRYQRWMTPGLLHYIQTGSGSGADLRTSGPSVYLFENGRETEIVGGFPSTWATNPVSDASSTGSFTYQMVIPKWTRWS